MNRLTDNDKSFGPITYGKAGWDALGIVLSSGSGKDYRNNIIIYCFDFAVMILLPNIVKPYKVKHKGISLDEKTRNGRTWYYEIFSREYGFNVYEGFLQIFYGPQTGSSLTTKSWCCFLPWVSWRFIEERIYDTDGNFFGIIPIRSQSEGKQIRPPKVAFKIKDYDRKEVAAYTYIKELEWRLGTGWFKWLSLFVKPKIRRSLNIEFSEEVGPDKGTWKGGILRTSIEIAPTELHQEAFERYCGETHSSKKGEYKITFIDKL